jgi:hypothetical protein
MEEEILDTSGFYKKDEEGNLLFAPNFIEAPTYVLVRENKNNYEYPVDGWVWYDEKP